MRASLLFALCALGAAVPAPIKDTVLTMSPQSADPAHDHPDGPTRGGATGAGKRGRGAQNLVIKYGTSARDRTRRCGT